MAFWKSVVYSYKNGCNYKILQEIVTLNWLHWTIIPGFYVLKFKAFILNWSIQVT